MLEGGCLCIVLEVAVQCVYRVGGWLFSVCIVLKGGCIVLEGGCSVCV